MEVKLSNELATIPAAGYSFDDVARMGKVIAASGLFGVKTPEQAVALMLVAQAQGLHPATAAMEYHVIDGRPSLKTDVMLGRFQQAGGRVEWIEHTDSKVSAKFIHPQGGEIIIDWDMQRARTAGLGGKQNWQKYPRQMLRARVISEGIRAVFPAVQQGLYTPEEVQDFEPVNAEPVGYAEAPMIVSEGSGKPRHTPFTPKQQAEMAATQAAIAARKVITTTETLAADDPRGAEFAAMQVPVFVDTAHPVGEVLAECDLPPIDADFDDLPAGTQHISQVLAALPEGIESAQVVGGNEFALGKPGGPQGVKFVAETTQGRQELFYFNLANAVQRSGQDKPWEYRGQITFRRVKEKSAGKWDIDTLGFPELEATDAG